MSNQALADLLAVNIKTVGNWRNGETMPSAADQLRLEALFPGYTLAASDPFRAALMASPLDEWRRQAVLAEYQRHLFEQERQSTTG